jgi:hypothetical protein
MGTSLPRVEMGIAAAAGPLLNLFLGFLVFLLLRSRLRPALLPLLLWGPVAMVQEGVNFSLGQLTPGGDAEWISTLGIPLPVLLVVGILLLVLGVALVATLLPLTGIEPDDSAGKKILIVLLGMCSLMLVRSAHAFLANPAGIIENLVPLIFSLLLAFLVILLHRPLTRIIARRKTPSPAQLTWQSPVIAMALGVAIFLFQVVALN